MTEYSKALDAETALYTELWKACAGPLVTVPQENELVFYFPQGHIEQDMSRQPPTQELVAKDLHGNEWRFRHIFREIDGTIRVLALTAFFDPCSERLARKLRWPVPQV
ncbi:unnamed protein product [Fraxinus pennsylvanica]|uniref:Uncharacterized protein n=1 Tax=Fraxinus pennsylvanica TaxID=56036 RepID=A0AAD1YMK0_9LAMI|nr:unnamed protein product [Fraxinus pennsylvanica]